MAGKKIAVVAGTAHEAYLKQMFTQAEIRPYPTAEAARAALKDKQVDLLFGDGIALSFWLNGTDSGGCCAFRGGPFLDSRFFGEGVGIAVKRGNDVLRQALNWALFQIWEKGSFTDLWLRYFPISPVLINRLARCRSAANRHVRKSRANSPSTRTPGRSRRRARSWRG